MTSVKLQFVRHSQEKSAMTFWGIPWDPDNEKYLPGMVPVDFHDQFMVFQFWHFVVDGSVSSCLFKELADLFEGGLAQIETEFCARVLRKVAFHVVRGLKR